MPEKDVEEYKIPSFAEYCLEVHLYKTIALISNRNSHEIEEFSGTFDCYCIECGKESVFKGTGCIEIEGEILRSRGIVKLAKNYFDSNRNFYNICRCTRNPEHYLIINSLVQNNTLIKIGQYPSMADIAIEEIKPYKKVLKDRYSEFNMAVKLAANGIGIGSFVYLRRIFEWLISEARQKAEKAGDFDAETFDRARMDEKIEILKDDLPDLLVEDKSLYGILSLGIHELSEDECKAHFEIVRQGIEEILDDKIEEERKEARRKTYKDKVRNLKQKFKKGES